MSLATFYADGHRGAAMAQKGPLWASAHHGQDVNGWPVGTPIPSIAAGKVTWQGFSKALGNVVQVHDDATGCYVIFCHMTGAAVHAGDRVALGAVVGWLGTTGTQTTGPHCHIAVTHSSVVGSQSMADCVDPWPLIVARRSGVHPAALGITPIPEIEEADMSDMSVIAVNPTGDVNAPGNIYVLGERRIRHVASIAAAHALAKRYNPDGEVIGVSLVDFPDWLGAHDVLEGVLDGDGRVYDPIRHQFGPGQTWSWDRANRGEPEKQ